MIPEEKLSTVPVVASLVGGRRKGVGKILDHEDGPRYLSNTDYGIQDRIWEGKLVINDIILGCSTVPDFTGYSANDIKELSFTFDQNGRYAIVIVIKTGGNVTNLLYWYDPLAMGYTTLTLDKTIITPKLFIDDKRESQNAINDILLFYIRGKKLCYIQQRDRFLTERVLADPVLGISIKKVGMSRNLRIQIQVEQ